MKQITVYNLEQLKSIIEEEKKSGKIWFRGHSNHKYCLQPNLYRNLYAVRDQFNIPIFPKKIENFDNSGDIVEIPDQLYIKSFYSKLDELSINYPKDYIEQICFAQHYGVKTRLLDWTTDMNVAFYFSQEKRKKKNKTAIYMLNPIQFNKYMSQMNKELFQIKFGDLKNPKTELERKLVQSCLIEVNEILSPSEINDKSRLTPLAIHGPKIDKRICRQSGNFIGFGALIWSIEYYENKELQSQLGLKFDTNLDCITKIILSSKLSDKIGTILRKQGINKKYIYGNDDIKDILSQQANISNEEVISKRIEECKAEYKEFKKNNLAIYLAKELINEIAKKI